nr:MAG TPA: Large polyvalent protein-associated domain 3 [Caudoviricetes sp.]
MKPWERFVQSTPAQQGPWTKFASPHTEIAPLAPNTDKKYTGLEKAKYALRAAGEGATLGLGDVVAGASNVLMNDLAGVTHGGSLAERLKSYGKALYHTTPLGLKDLFSSEDFKQGRKDFVEEQEDFAKAHPALNVTGELAGGLVTGIGGAGKLAGAKMLSRLGKWGTAAATGAASGAGYGFGAGLTRDADELSMGQGVKEALPGAFLGGAFGVAVPGVFGAGSKAANWLGRSNRTFRKVSKAAGDDLQKSIDTQTPLLDIGNSKVAKMGKTAKRNNEKAGDLLDAFVEQGYGKQGDKLHGIVSKYIPASGNETAQSITAAKEALSKAAYEPMQQLGELRPNNPSLANLVKTNPQVQRAILTAKKNVPQLPKDGFELFNEAKKVLDDMAAPNPLASGAEKSRIRYAQEARRALISELDKATGGQYKAALREYGDLLGAERALNRGRELLNMDPQAAVASYRKAGAAEREGLRVGLAQELQRRIRKGNVNGSSRNIAATLVGSEQNKKLFRAVLGKDADKFIEELSGVSRAVHNYGTVKGGSDTAENLMLSREGLNFLRHPVEGVINLAGRGLDWLSGLNQEQVARMLIDPGYAAIMRAKAGALPSSAYVDISGAGGAFANIFGPLTKREKDVMRKGVQKHLIRNVRGTRVYNEELGRNVSFNRPGIEKAINSSQDLEKLKMTQYAAEIAKQGRPYQPRIRSGLKVYDYLMTPVNVDGKKSAAATTLRNGYFYNVNPVDYAIKKPQDLVVPLTKQGPLEAQNPRRLSQKPTGAIAKGNNSIANNQKKNKWAKNNFRSMKDFLILLQRPFTVGLQGNIAAENGKEGN